MSAIITTTYQAGSIPAVVWSGIMGSAITVIGVLVTNLGVARRHREQLAHAARESTVKREMELRRDIYMPAIEATVIATSAIGSQTNPLTLHADVEEKFTDAAAKLGKALSIAKPETVRTFGALTTSMRVFYTKLLIRRQPIMSAHSRLSGAIALIDRNSQDRDRWIQSRLDVLYNEGVNQQRDDFLVRQVEFCNRMINHWTIQRDQSQLDLSRAQVAFLKEMLDLYPNMAETMGMTCVAVREDFAFEGDDIDAVRQVLADNAATATQFLRDMVASFEVELQAHEHAFAEAQAQREAQANLNLGA
ncbi:hypothetical protein BLA50215_05746 [Burkholderia lata]|uniref:hypothetical protein n=1 Tax=Burkholderia lata (strain ATCC 17760 / DSM 23089 / LMG 22485 / NCIMB 9086 / R18194 / 383) TaxID=482957 RepID=UPI001453545A|nr:hypothetical protein [Burkholderia lata]VWD45958.1 hypothetical protein BLA50215_05746 [Burkholderia lata]